MVSQKAVFLFCLSIVCTERTEMARVVVFYVPSKHKDNRTEGRKIDLNLKVHVANRREMSHQLLSWLHTHGELSDQVALNDKGVHTEVAFLTRTESCVT